MGTMLLFKDAGWTIATEAWTLAQSSGSRSKIHYLYPSSLTDQSASSVSLPITIDEFLRLVKEARGTGIVDLREITR